jgi:hypothetical protein
MLYDPLNFDYELLHGQRIVAIRASGIKTFASDASTVCDEVAICLTDSALVVSVDLDTDQIKLQRIDDPEALAGLSAWDTFELLQDYVGQELGWCWVGRNYRGYADTFVMSFAGIEPQVALVGAASTLLFYKMLKV